MFIVTGTLFSVDCSCAARDDELNVVSYEMSCKMECACLQQEQRRSHRVSEGVSNDGSEDEEENEDGEDADEDSGQSQVLQGSDASDTEAVDVVTEEENDEDDKEDDTKDEVWMNEKRHSGDGEVAVDFLVSIVGFKCVI